MRTLKCNMRRMAMCGLVVVGVVSLTGCDDLFSGGMAYTGGLGSYGYYDSGWNSYDYGWGGNDYMWPSGGLIAGDTLDRTAEAWDQYIRGDYYGGEADDLSTPTAWASGYTWP